MDLTKTYYKVTDEKPWSIFKYKEGLLHIVDDDPKTIDSVTNIFFRVQYFTDIEHIYNYVAEGTSIREVTLPYTDPDFKVVQEGLQWKSNKLIIGKKHDIFDYELLKLPLRLDTWVMDVAASSGRLDAVKWLHENRTEGCTNYAMEKAAEHGHLDVVKYLHENRTEYCDDFVMDCAAKGGHLEVVKWLHHNRTEGCTNYAMNSAIENGHLEVVKWLHKNRDECQGCYQYAVNNAEESGYFDVVEYVKNNIEIY